jgi:plasmid stability protein
MKRTTIYLDPDLEARLKLESARRQRPMADLIREAIREKLDTSQRVGSPHSGAFSSRRNNTADRAEELLGDTNFGRD